MKFKAGNKIIHIDEEVEKTIYTIESYCEGHYHVIGHGEFHRAFIENNYTYYKRRKEKLERLLK